ncbi:Spindle-body formation-associated protein [Penicillium cinerascens]|uniref:Spindle-body formation-associated protein n=1 Tax=Penicillium cinerascens TaxID=70096 RepID=A0A9W9M736_9EURO|nr:Spindle-body formation-associated protein [Penicillium cinerascens]KAJ5191710.1 Spindle-body formation-associated protein [Penicillium cinerascens]
MLDWMKGNEGDAADTSKVLEPPETPAPVFAIRAFKSALFGTPGAEEEDKHVPQTKPSGHQRSKSDTTNPIHVQKEDPKLEHDATFNPSGSPTKSILVTPGTIANRRKTVSFGEGVVDNEGKRDARITKTPPNPAGNITTQWMSGSADGKPRSKLTQTLIDARDNASKNAESSTNSTPDSASDAKPVTRSLSKDEATTEDITLNLDEPRSESGKYWKTEFDNYRVRTNREIKKLIHYRSVAKSYARKKDSESLRLADKLREEEEKVVEMERQVSRLASAIVGEGSQAGKDGLIQDLTKQTTLALQYKQQVTSLRKSLEQQGVVKGDAVQALEPTKEEQPSANSSELRKVQQELKQANAQIEEMKRQNPDLSTLQSLAQSSEKKAQDLEKENKSLKQTLARVKQEMSRYEGRRKEKETKLKQREAKLEARIQEYRDRLKTTSQEHRASEEALRANFEEERRRMQNQIDLLKVRSAGTDRGPTLRSLQRHSFSPRKEYSGVHVYDFAGNDHPEIEEEATEDLEAPPSPSPRSKARHTRNVTTGALDLKRAARGVAADDDEVTHYLNQILPKQHNAINQERDGIPPSSPPDIAPLKSLNRAHTKYQSTRDGQRTYRSLYLRDPDNADTGHAHTQRPRAHIKSTLDSISGLPASRANYAGYTISAGELGTRRGLADMRGELLSPERVAAAKSRLKQKHDSRKGTALAGKENF